MSGKSALYLSIAHRCAAQGETGRAIVTIVNALRNNPKFLDTQPEAIDFLAEIYIPGFEEEIHRLETRYPSFAVRFSNALIAHGKSDLAAMLEQSFSAYCVEQMKTVQSSGNESYASAYEQERVSVPGPAYRQTAVSSSFYRAVPRNEAVPNESEMQVRDQGYRETAAESGFFRPASRSGWRKQTTGESCERLPVVVSELASDVWMPSIQDMASHHSGQFAYEKREFASHNIDRCTTEGLRRFDRIRTQCLTEQKAEDYADTAADRVILDFDNRVKETPKAAMFAASKLKFRSYAEELAEYKELSKTEVKRPIFDPVQNPMEVVAETTHALSETPSVEPYSVRHPLRFKLTPQNIVTCVFVCLLFMIGFVSWKTAVPRLEKRAIEGVSQTYLLAAESGQADPVHVIDGEKPRFVDETWMDGYRQFLSVWQMLYHGGDLSYIDHESSDFPADVSAAHAAYIMQEMARKHVDRAKLHFESVSNDVWRDHAYFKSWSEAEIDISNKDYRTASIRFEKLLNSPLAPFALVRLGLLALEDSPAQADIRQRFLVAVDSTEVVPGIARCVRAMLRHESAGNITFEETSSLNSPYAEYCAMGRIFSAIQEKNMLNMRDLEMLKNSEPLTRGEFYRLEAVIGAELYQQNPSGAVKFFNELSLPSDHPLHKRLLGDILSRSLRFGNWGSLHELNSHIPEDVGYMAAARIIDTARETGVIEYNGRRAEGMMKYGAAGAGAAVGDIMDEALVEAESGKFTRALALVRNILSSHPEAVEPLLLQAQILSQSGNAYDAAVILEHAMATSNASAVFIVLSNLYRVRGNLELNNSAFVLKYLSFADPVLESARCEIFWRLDDPYAQPCLHNLGGRPGKQAKSTWVMLHLDARRAPIGNSAQWAKAGSGALSFPGYHLAYARKLIEDGEFNSATRAYTSAILNDQTTATPEVIEEFARAYEKRQRRYEGTKKFEELIKESEKLHRNPEVLGALHYAAARLYQPENGHSTARQHLGSALELLGDRPEILRGLVKYYEAKEKPEQAASWRARLNRILNQ